MSHQARQRQEHACRVWWHAGFGAWVWRCWDCVPPGQTYNDRADTWDAALGDLEAHFHNGQGLTHNMTRTTDTTTHVERWAA